MFSTEKYTWNDNQKESVIIAFLNDNDLVNCCAKAHKPVRVYLYTRLYNYYGNDSFD